MSEESVTGHNCVKKFEISVEDVFKLVADPLGQYEFGAATNAVSFPDCSCLEFPEGKSNQLSLTCRYATFWQKLCS